MGPFKKHVSLGGEGVSYSMIQCQGVKQSTATSYRQWNDWWKDEKSQPQIYWPISLTCVACKLMERVIAKHIYVHLASNSLLSHAQHGFVGGHSTCTNLLECLNDWTLAIQNKKSVTDDYFSRAFDTVSHKNCSPNCTLSAFERSLIVARTLYLPACLPLNGLLEPSILISF